MARVLNASLDINLGGENASNEVISSQKAVKTYIDTQDNLLSGNLGDLSNLTTSVKTDLVSAVNSLNVDTSYTANCPAITPSSGVATWTVTHNLGSTGVICTLYNKDGAEIVKNTTIDSANQVTVTFNATGSISASDYSIVVLSSGGTSSGGGGSITVDDTLSSTSTNPVQNKVIYPSLSDFIPAGTVINVGASRTHTTLTSALNSLANKWSNGQVTIKLDDGTYTEKLNISLVNAIPLIQVLGTSRNNTIIHYEPTGDWEIHCTISGGSFLFSTLTFSGSNSKNSEGMMLDNCANIQLQNVSFKNYQYGCLEVSMGSNATLKDSISFENVGTAGTIAVFTNTGGNVTSSAEASISINNFGTGFSTSSGGKVCLFLPSMTFTNVTTQYNPAINTNTTSQTGWNFKR